MDLQKNGSAVSLEAEESGSPCKNFDDDGREKRTGIDCFVNHFMFGWVFFL